MAWVSHWHKQQEISVFKSVIQQGMANQRGGQPWHVTIVRPTPLHIFVKYKSTEFRTNAAEDKTVSVKVLCGVLLLNSKGILN